MFLSWIGSVLHQPEAGERFGDKDVHVQENAAILFQHVELCVDVALCLLRSNFAFKKNKTRIEVTDSDSSVRILIRQNDAAPTRSASGSTTLNFLAISLSYYNGGRLIFSHI
jgi:hypothetical protein